MSDASENDSHYILGIGQTHNSSACLIKDGRLVACVSEERFNREKNTTAFPSTAIKYVLRQAGITADDLAAVIHSYSNPVSGLALRNPKLASTAYNLLDISRQFGNSVVSKIPTLDLPLRNLYKLYLASIRRSYEKRFRSQIASTIGVSLDNVYLEDHHVCHAFAGYAFTVNPDMWKRRLLVLTLDAEGDDKSATVSVFEKGSQKVIASTPGGNSIGVLYAAVTEFLGMKVNEHEYKVMGLAPYASKSYSEQVRDRLAPLIVVEDLIFRAKPSSGAFPKVLPRILSSYRFDAIAGGVQLLLEERIVEWVQNAINATGVHDVVISGGVFMNVKANKAILEMPDVKTLTVCPSASDESTPIGAAYRKYCASVKQSQVPPIPVTNLYLGPSYSETEIEECIHNEVDKDEFDITELRRSEESRIIATLLMEGEIIARLAGKMEFGARALGNRSILADPSSLAKVREINEQIKGRDFWMPFACSILEEDKSAFLVDPKNANAAYMALAFDTVPENRDKIIAGIHQYDFTVRPQIVKRTDNPRYYELIRNFKELTGIGAILNTSFNLHGEPIVCSPHDALDVFRRSGLRILQLDHLLIKKRI